MSDGTWWGEHDLPPGAAGLWRVGPLSVWLGRLRDEWRLAHDHDAERYSDRLLVDVPTALREAEILAADHEIERLVARQLEARLRVTAACADRPVVTKPTGAFRILAGGRATLYVSTPLWLRIETAEKRNVLFERAVVRPTDTWFGPSTLAGELCYASRTSIALELDELPLLPGRAITRLRVSNRAVDDFQILRLALPAPNLALWHDRDHPERGLWTSAVTFERSSDGDHTRVDVASGPPADLSEPVRVAAPRLAGQRSVLARAMSSILR